MKIEWTLDGADLPTGTTVRQSLATLLLGLGGRPEQCAPIQVVLGELLSNCARHAQPGRVLASCAVQNGTVTIQVTSKGPAFAVSDEPVHPSALRGRGLQIVRALAQTLTIARLGDTNVVRVVMPLDGIDAKAERHASNPAYGASALEG